MTIKMRPFDLEAAKRGEAVCTRSGRPARIVCMDGYDEEAPILALIEMDRGGIVYKYTETGSYALEDGNDCAFDLMMVADKPVPDPKSVADKKEDVPDRFYMVYLEGQRTPAFKHPTYTSACKEATRLSMEHHSTAYVLRAFMQIRVTTKMIELEEPEDSDLPF